MIKLALITKDQPRFFFPQFLSLLKESDEFEKLIVDHDDRDIFDVFPVYLNEDFEGLRNSKHYIKVCNDLHIDTRTIPDYLPEWEVKELKKILMICVSIAREDLRFHR